MGNRYLKVATGLALALAVLGPSGHAAAAQGLSGSSRSRADYVPPVRQAPLVIASASTPAAAPSYTGMPTPRDEISVTGAYAGNSAREFYCIVFARAC